MMAAIGEIGVMEVGHRLQEEDIRVGAIETSTGMDLVDSREEVAFRVMEVDSTSSRVTASPTDQRRRQLPSTPIQRKVQFRLFPSEQTNTE